MGLYKRIEKQSEILNTYHVDKTGNEVLNEKSLLIYVIPFVDSCIKHVVMGAPRTCPRCPIVSG